jgi:hypothetical protein
MGIEISSLIFSAESLERSVNNSLDNCRFNYLKIGSVVNMEIKFRIPLYAEDFLIT